MTELTPNQKAATFIGWKPQYMWRTFEPDTPLAARLLPAPDMSRPENYMRAVEEICKSRCALPAFRYNEQDGWISDFRWRNPHPQSEWGTDDWLILPEIGGCNVAEMIVDTLAALYDLDHGNG